MKRLSNILLNYIVVGRALKISKAVITVQIYVTPIQTGLWRHSFSTTVDEF